ncbi:MAG: putative ABC transport system permease protein [Saprospiraceae bacterium]|jgi:putative ABC transport system permease protein|tara:strand:- start:339 stop:1592 length:1254 start_codon:yes stop_codon:yes gene_type:complete
MKVFFKIIYESMVQALQSLVGNKLRTFLSLLGITIGIFCIIAVKSAVDSLEQSIKSGFNELGSDVLYVDKMPWGEDPNQNYWKYAKRPDASYEDFEVIFEKSKMAELSSYTVFTGGRTIKYKSSSVSNTSIMGSTFEYQELQNLEIEKGRYFTQQEYAMGANKLVLGFQTAQALFNTIDPIGKYVKLFGQKYQVIGVLKSEGDNPFNFLNFDEVLWVSFPNMKRFVNTNENSRIGRMLNIKAKKGVEVQDLKGEITGILRASRRLKPKEDENFALNELSALSGVLDAVFGVLNIVGLLIGFFALLVGMFSVANIMFVSVKERTNIIGIKKALGAQRFIILLEFLIESIILCLIGGLVGLGLVIAVLKIISSLIPFEMYLSMYNVVFGVSASVIVGIISGIIPAIQASKLDPVVAMRG